MAFRKNKSKGYWSRYIINSLFYIIGFFPGVIVGYLVLWVGVFIIGGFLIYFGVLKDLGKNMGGSSGGPSYRCCRSCKLFYGGQCSANNKRISDPSSEICDSYI